MKKTIFLTLLLIANMAYSQQTINVIPYPQEVKYTGTNFAVIGFKLTVDKKLTESKNYAQVLVKTWNKRASSLSNSVSNELPISLTLDESINNGTESYSLSITETSIRIRSASSRGCFYAMQTLNQLVVFKGDEISLPQLEINDYPNYRWRSFMLDESRYFFGKEFVLRLLDELAALKINKFHWHLTDDQGWRIEIKKYPELTRKGAWRKDSQIGGWKSELRSGNAHGGFYTQKEIKEIIDYAQVRNIDVIPEIEMPGHSSAAIAAYPWLGVIGELTEVPVVFGKHKDSYNISDPRVIGFLHNVLDEVCELFPSEIIHIGGDEVLFGAWSESGKMQAYLKQQNLVSPADGQIYFTNSISDYLAKKGKRMMGWNEILGQNIHGFDNSTDYLTKTSLSKKTIIHFWRGDIKLITEAAQKGYEIVNSISSSTYLDYKYNAIPLKKMYDFNPIPEGLEKKYQGKIIGVGCQMWTEWTPTYKDVEYQTFPRIAAMAEVAWSGKREYSDFVNRLRELGKDWKNSGINFPLEEIK